MPFTEQQFFAVFGNYNEAVWPAQALLFLLAILSVIGALWSRRGVALIVAGLWAWCGIAYHWIHFARVNPAAWFFGALFIGAAALIARDRDVFAFDDVPPVRRSIGLAIVIYALLAYPAIGYLAGHLYPATPTFGAPCPLTIFTIGLYLMAARPLPLLPVAVPLAWSLLGLPAMLKFGMLEDAGLPIAAGVLVTFLISERLPRSAPSAPHPAASAPPLGA